MKFSRRLFVLPARFATLLPLLLAALGAQAQSKWDLPAAYAASNFHTENLAQFANDVDKASGGKLKITVPAHPAPRA